MASLSGMGGAMSSGLQSAMSNPMFYLGAQSLMQTPSVGRPAPNPFSMQNILAAQQMADAQKQRQFLPNLLAEQEAYENYNANVNQIALDYQNQVAETERQILEDAKYPPNVQAGFPLEPTDVDVSCSGKAERGYEEEPCQV